MIRTASDTTSPVLRASLQALHERERRRYLEQHPRSAALAAASAPHFLYGVPLHWMRDWALPHPLFVRSAEGHRLRIDDVEVSGQDDSLLVRLAVTIPTGFLKWSKGIVYLVGRPRYDVGTGIISVDELDYSVDSRSALVAIGDWLLHDVVRAKLREKARWRVGEQLAQARADLEAGLNRDLGNGVRLKGTVAEVQPLFVRVFEGAVVAQVQATGAAELSVTAAPLASQ